MKTFRIYLLPALCFATAWIAAAALGKHRAQEPSSTTPLNSRTSSLRPPRDATSNGNARINSITRDFTTLPSEKWAERWNRFASESTVEEMQILVTDGSPILTRIAAEELAVRSTQAPHGVQGALAALAEMDPDRAWNHYLTEDPNGVIRTLAAKDPQDTLRRLRSVPALNPVSRYGELDGAATVWHTPISSLFGAWARTDPSAAVAALKTLPLSDRSTAANGLALTWACHDGPAALRFILEFNKSGNVSYQTRHIRMDVILRTALIRQPEETARMLATHSALREAMRHTTLTALKPLYHADPAATTAWLRDQGEDHHIGDLSEYLFCIDPKLAEDFLTDISAGHGALSSPLVRIARLDPDFAEDLASRLGHDAPSLTPPAFHHRINYRPDLALAEFLEASRRHPSPAATIQSLQWTPEQLYQLASTVANLMPEKAADLATALPASFIAEGFARDSRSSSYRPRDAVATYWPELAERTPPTVTKPSPPMTNSPTYHPPGNIATATSRLLEKDPATARSWVSRLDPGPARTSAELTLVRHDATHNPPSALRWLSDRPDLPPSQSAPIWHTAIRRILHTGGDWQSELAKVPEPVRRGPVNRNTDFTDSLNDEARLRKILQTPISR